MAPDPSPIPAPQPLSAFDVDLLTDFVSGHDPRALAASRNMTLADLLAWRNRPQIHQFITDYQQLVEESTGLLAASVRNTLITELTDLVQATPDLLEKRRAAQTLQRLISRPRRRAATLHPTGTSTTPSTTTPASDPSLSPASSHPASPLVPSSSTSPLPDSSPESTSCSSCSSCSTSSSDPSSSAAPLPDPVSTLLKPDGTIDLAALAALAAKFEAQDDQDLDEDLDDDLDDDTPDPRPCPADASPRRPVSSPAPSPAQASPAGAQPSESFSPARDLTSSLILQAANSS